MFARFGHMNPKRDKDKEKKFSKGFHTPPENKGIYAFIWPYIELFLIGWNDSLFKKTGNKDEYGFDILKPKNIKKFQHHGEIWTHFVDQARKTGVGLQYKDSWVKIHTSNLEFLLKKVISQDCKFLKNNGPKEKIKNPYKIGSCSTITMSKDHLEVFISNKVKESK